MKDVAKEKKSGKKKIRFSNTGTRQFLLWAFVFVVLMLLAFQNPLEAVFYPAKYIDETVGLAGVLLCCVFHSIVREKLKKRELFLLLLFLAIYVSAGVISSIINHYQSFRWAAIDFYTNLKFFMALAEGIILGTILHYDELKKPMIAGSRLITIALFICFILNRIFNLWASKEIRHGINTVRLFYYHPTYLAAVMVFLLAVFALFYEKNNIIFMLMDLILLFFTTRAKSFAAVLIYVYLWFVIVIIQSGIKWWHIVAVAITSVAIAWDRIILFLPGFSRSDAGEYSARSTELTTSLQLLKDYFPFGTGFGTFATDVAGNHYSPVYIRYGFCDSAQMSLVEGRLFYFFDDVFYPIIIGQTGIIGMVAFAFIIIVLVFLSMNMKKIDFRYYFSSVFIIGYLLVSSTAEPTFNNALSIPISLLFGMIIGWTDQRGADSEKKQG